MKRDLDLVRRILLKVEAAGPTDWLDAVRLELPDDRDVVVAHIKLMKEAGLVHGNELSDFMDEDHSLTGITWAGYDFLESSRNETIWAKFMQTAKDQAVGLTIEIATAWLKNEIYKKLGISGTQ